MYIKDICHSKPAGTDPSGMRYRSLCIVLVALVACPLLSHAAVASTANARNLSSAYNEFGLSLLAALRRENPRETVVVSPLSASMALAMAQNGAAGETRRAIAHTIHLSSMPTYEANALASALLRSLSLANDGRVRFALANALWTNRPQRADRTFLNIVRQDFSGTLGPLEVGAINAWTSANTRRMIPKLLDRLDPQSVAVLTNALVMEARWTFPFRRNRTAPQDFTSGNGRKHRVPMMFQTATLRYYADESLQVVRLPYGRGRLAMYVFLPKHHTNLGGIFARLAGSRFDDITRHMANGKVLVALPRFNADTKVSLSDSLTSLGMGIAFSRAADFRYVDRLAPLFISEVMHATRLHVHEEGTEAAAATAIVISQKAARPLPHVIPLILVNRPFCFSIRDERSTQLLFVGAIEDV